jgi:DNA-3-methyladenine glycosylase II
VMAAVIKRAGSFQVQLEADLFKAIVRAIISQQISTSAARSIFKRLCEAAGDRPLLEAMQGMSVEQFRAAGISPQKAGYLRDLASKVHAQEVRLPILPTLENDEVIEELIRVKGIGRWTVQMLLIFSLGRLNVFPGDDLGVRTAIKRLYHKRALPGPRQLKKFGKLWQPYASIAAWYCWRSLEFKGDSTTIAAV